MPFIAIQHSLLQPGCFVGIGFGYILYFKYNKVSLQALIQKLIKGVAGLGFRLDLSYIVSITIAAEFKDKWEFGRMLA